MTANVPTESNPFQSPAIAARQAEALVAVEQSRAVAEVQAAMLVAQKFPRDQRAAMDKILMACTRPTLAEQALYSYGRGGTDVTGPTIRLAEALAQCWGNIKTSVRELDQRDGLSTVQTIAWDLETGYQADKVFQVRHVRDRSERKGGAVALSDQRDIYELVANQGARRLRACILAVIPGDVVEAAVKQCEKTLALGTAIDPQAVTEMLEAFAAFGVTREQIEKRIQRRLDSVTPALMVQLRKIYNSLRDGMSKPAEWFELEQPAGEPAADASTEQRPAGGKGLRDAVKRAEAAKTATKTAAPPQAYAGPEEVEILQQIDRATDREVAALALDQARGAPFYAKAEEAFAKRWPAAE